MIIIIIIIIYSIQSVIHVKTRQVRHKYKM